MPESEVEDIVQSTLTDALESPHAPTDSESLRRSIFGVAKNKVVDYHRRAGRETFELPEVPGKPAPHAEADLLRWAEKHLPPGDENKTTLDWMIREGEGEKLEWIAESEKVPAPRVRQRVSRLRRHLKTHWQKEVALLATFGVLITAILLHLRKNEPEPIAKDVDPQAEELRKVGLEKCRALDWAACLERLDEAKRLDPAGDARRDVQQARDDAKRALTPNDVLPDVPESPAPPTSSTTITPPPAPTTTAPRPESSDSFTPTPVPTLVPTTMVPPQKPVRTFASGWDDSSIPVPTKTAPESKTAMKMRPITKSEGSIDSLDGAKSPASSSKAVPKPTPTK